MLATATEPVLVVRLIPLPAVTLVTPMLLIVILPVLVLILIAVPATALNTPVLVIVTLPVAVLTAIPAPATLVNTPALVNVNTATGPVTVPPPDRPVPAVKFTVLITRMLLSKTADALIVLVTLKLPPTLTPPATDNAVVDVSPI